MNNLVENYYITERTSSIDSFSKSFEYIITGSSIRSREMSDKFRSVGDGLLSKGFYLGQNLTEYIAEIEIQNSNSCILSIPSKGEYSTRISNKPFKKCTPESGSLFMPAESIHYLTDVNAVEDLMVIINYDQLAPILEKNYNINSVKRNGFDIEITYNKVKVVYDLIINNLQVLRLYPHLRESLHFKSSIKEIVKVFLAELIADSLNASFKLYSSPDSFIVKNAEELIEANPEIYFSIQEIADQVNTSTRNLQLAFRKHRGHSPMQFLKERKLYKSRSFLMNPDSDTTIKKIAYDSGFLNLSSFSNYYQQLFGELPSETLAKAKQISPLGQI